MKNMGFSGLNLKTLWSDRGLAQRTMKVNLFKRISHVLHLKNYHGIVLLSYAKCMVVVGQSD